MKHFLKCALAARLILLGAVGLGHAASKAPERTGDFLTYCKSNAQGCEDEIFLTYVAIAFDAPPTTCATKADLGDKAGLRKKLIDWMTKRQELADRLTAESIPMAFKAVYPCR